jgi:hypothetical protein
VEDKLKGYGKIKVLLHSTVADSIANAISVVSENILKEKKRYVLSFYEINKFLREL